MTTSMIPSRATSAGRATLLTALGVCAVLSSACTQEPKCEELDTCGGAMPTGTWVLGTGHPSCSEDLYSPPTDTRLLGGEITPARQPTIEPALWDWCYLLLTGAGDGNDVQLKPPRFYYESGEVGSVFLTYTPSASSVDTGDFTVSITKTGHFTLDFPAVCIRAFGATDRPDLAIDPSGSPVQVCERLEVPLANSGLGEGSYPNTDCYPNPEDPLGCLCEFDVTETGGTAGTYHRQGSQILHNPSGNYSSRADYCVQGDRLQLTGADGAYLFNVAGLRTMDLGTEATTPVPFPPPNP